MTAISRWYMVIAHLLYPGFLASMIYAASEKFLREPEFFIGADGLLVAGLLFHYALDYIYTEVNNDKSSYPVTKFVPDLVIVVCLYLALKVSLREQVSFWLPAAVWWMLITKIAALAWELVDGLGQAWDRVKGMEIAMDAGFGLLYAAVGIWGLGVWWLATVVIVDGIAYLVHEYCSARWGARPVGEATAH